MKKTSEGKKEMMSYRRILGKVTLALLFVFSSAVAGAVTTVIIEPDDYSLGTNLSTVSPYVTLGYQSGDNQTLQIVTSTVPTNDSGVQYPAPTGDHVFGPIGGGGFAGGGCSGSLDTNNWGCQGFVMSFNQSVSHVSLQALNWGYPPGLGVIWYAWDGSGDQIGGGQIWPVNNLGIPFLADIQLDGIRTFMLGGSAGTAAVSFDHLTFDIATVPAPGSAWLFASSLCGLIGTARWKFKIS